MVLVVSTSFDECHRMPVAGRMDMPSTADIDGWMLKFVPVPTNALKLASRALRTVTASNGKVVWYQDGKLQALDQTDKTKILVSVFVACPPNATMPTYFCTLSIAERFLAINASNEPFLQDQTQYFFQGLIRRCSL
jgi:hypothetical protein